MFKYLTLFLFLSSCSTIETVKIENEHPNTLTLDANIDTILKVSTLSENFMLKIADDINIPSIITFDGSIESPCGQINSPSYCFSNNIIYIDPNSITELSFCCDDSIEITYIIMHEYGHVLTSWTYLDKYKEYSNSTSSAREIEHLADCITGWLISDQSFRYNEDEISQFKMLALDLGSSPNSTHGTGQQRRDAWLNGFEKGNCDAYV